MRTELIAEAARLEIMSRELAGRLEVAEHELEVLRAGPPTPRRGPRRRRPRRAAGAERAAAIARDCLAMARLRAEIGRLERHLDPVPGCPGAAAAGAGGMVEQRRHAGAPGSGAARNQECLTAAARVATAATRLDFKPSADRQARAGGEVIDTTQPLRLAKPTELELEGYGRLVVTPAART